MLHFMVPPVGIVSVATHLPPEVRTNTWWRSETLRQWGERRTRPPDVRPEDLTPAMARVHAAMAGQADDPFQGVTERRVLAAGMAAADMEADAAEQAITRSGIDRSEIDILFAHTAVPEYLLSNPACALHRRLGLPPGCFTMQAEASGYSFMAQLSLAVRLIASGHARYALLVQSCIGSRLIDPEDPASPAFGDGAAAVLVGPVRQGGVLAAVHRTDGSYPRALVASVPGRRWYDDGRIVLHRADPAAAVRVFLETADRANEVVSEALREAGQLAGEVDFFAVHQGTPWLRAVTQETIGLSRARFVDTYATTGYLFSVSLPLVLEAGERRGLLRHGDLVVLHGGGVGATYGAIVMRWDSGSGSR
jgi:3-oxoacyl-[acyl-carrier-protein] synthase-3